MHITKRMNSTNKGEKQSIKRESRNLKRLSDTLWFMLRCVWCQWHHKAAVCKQPELSSLNTVGYRSVVPWPHRAWQCPLPHPLMNSLLQLTSVQWDLGVNGNIFQCRTMKWSSPLCAQIWVLYFNKTKKTRFQHRKSLCRQQQCWVQLTQVFEYGKITKVFTDPMCNSWFLSISIWVWWRKWLYW